MPKVFGYCRASTAGQNLTFEVQRKTITAAYEARWQETHEFAGFFEDSAVSGAKPFTERPEGLRVWAAASPGDIIVVSKLDRAFRKVLDFSKLLELCQMKSISLVFLDIGIDTSTALGRFVSQLICSVAELERHWISTRTKEALAAKVASGSAANQKGAAGWMRNKSGKWVPDEIERQIIAWVQTQVKRGVGWTTILKTLEDKNVRRWNGKKYQRKFLYYATFAESLGWPLSETEFTIRDMRRNRLIKQLGRCPTRAERLKAFMKTKQSTNEAHPQQHSEADQASPLSIALQNDDLYRDPEPKT
jgi:DNA invertase Pin-like site-specific DNA recombinase